MPGPMCCCRAIYLSGGCLIVLCIEPFGARLRGGGLQGKQCPPNKVSKRVLPHDIAARILCFWLSHAIADAFSAACVCRCCCCLHLPLLLLPASTAAAAQPEAKRRMAPSHAMEKLCRMRTHAFPVVLKPIDKYHYTPCAVRPLTRKDFLSSF